MYIFIICLTLFQSSIIFSLIDLRHEQHVSLSRLFINRNKKGFFKRVSMLHNPSDLALFLCVLVLTIYMKINYIEVLVFAILMLLVQKASILLISRKLKSKL